MRRALRYRGMPTIPKRWKYSRTLALLYLSLIVTSCGSVTKPSSALTARPVGERQDVCLVLPVPDFATPTRWMKDYNVVWSRLKCDISQR